MTETHTDHLAAPHRALGLRPPTNQPALMLAPLLTGVVPGHPTVADHFGRIANWTLGANDRFATCGPTSVANLLRIIFKYLLGQDVAITNSAIFDLYRRSGNPDFDPRTGADDNGVVMQKMLGALRSGGIEVTRADGSREMVKAIAYAKVNPGSLDEVRAAISIFGGVLFGVNLETAQHRQTDARPPVWDYVKSGNWGGHAVVAGGYNSSPTGVDVPAVSWAEVVGTTDRFLAMQLREVWVPVFPQHLAYPAFQDGVDLSGLAAAFQALTKQVLPLPTPSPTPAPVPTPDPTPVPPAKDPADVALADASRAWVTQRHTGTPKLVADALKTWMAKRGMS